jgi:hypothetical protein
MELRLSVGRSSTSLSKEKLTEEEFFDSWIALFGNFNLNHSVI